MSDSPLHDLSRPWLWIADPDELQSIDGGTYAIQHAREVVLASCWRNVATKLGINEDEFRQITSLPADHPAIRLIRSMLLEYVPASRLEIGLTETQVRNRGLVRHVRNGIANGRWKSARQAFYGERKLTSGERTSFGFKGVSFGSMYTTYKETHKKDWVW